MGKLGILWELDRKTGQFRSAHDLGYQDQLDVNPVTGKVTYRAGVLEKQASGQPIDFCPGFGGVKNWRALAYSPDTRAIYVPAAINCQRSVWSTVERVEGSGGNSVRPYAGERTLATLPHPKTPEHRGRLIAMDVRTGRIMWDQPRQAGLATSALTTGGGLVIVGDTDRYVSMHDLATGKLLYQTRLPAGPTGFPISYAVRGKQYVAVPVETRGGLIGGNGVFVFALPDAPSGSPTSSASR
jgi:alcohol dehydrogenase (cytochrome c)